MRLMAFVQRGASADVKLLLLSAMAIFMVTVVVGILNGADLVTFTRPALLAHVHAGTLGWITLGVFAAVIWMFFGGNGGGPGRPATRWLSVFAILAVLLYVVAFYADVSSLIPVFGSLVLLAIVVLLVMTMVQGRRITLTIPHVMMLAALVSLTLGAVFGVVLGLGGALANPDLLSGGFFIGHTAAMVIGYLILAGMAIIEWGLVRDGAPARADRLGLAQVFFPFAGGITLIIGGVFDIFALIVLNVPFEMIGVGIFVWRMGRKVGTALWQGPGTSRLFGASAVFLLINIGLLVYLIVNYADDFLAIPLGLLFALDHIMFIGVMTNAIFGLVGEAGGEARRYGFAEPLIFGGMNLGLIGFAFGLVLESALLKVVFTPIMGIAIIGATVAFALRLLTSRP